ncbi:2OG-Fe(II) oxygenase [Mesorhizobium sp. M1339]|uniref:2OG-Fe(II) oxygenase n=1 Tax=Mesorhizobium sp. M1339 TaxID=2957086 RepID=UPI00333741C0
MRACSVADSIDLSRYPINRLDTPIGKNFVEKCRARFDETGVLVLEGFLRPGAVEEVRDEVTPLIPLSFARPHRTTVYLKAKAPEFPDDHPRNRTVTTNMNVVAYDQISRDSTIKSLYNYQQLRRFLSAIVGYPQLYPYEDALGSLNVNILGAGQELGWHFDNSDFAVTLLLQAADEGGVFEYLPNARTDQDPGFEKVNGVLDGGRDEVRILSQEPGSLVVFRGRYALHRVTPVKGDQPRIIAVLAYDSEPGVQLTEYNRNLLYGRVQ